MSIFDGFWGNVTISGLPLKEIKQRGHVVIEIPTDNITLNLMMKYLCMPVKIYLKPKNDILDNEEVYFEHISKIFDLIRKDNRDFLVKINVKNRELFRQKFSLALIPENALLTIHASDNDYSLKAYKAEEKKIEAMVASIRGSKLSPLEKFLAVYDIVKNYKPYNDAIGAVNDSFLLDRILKDDNEYIVCAGYARLLEELLTRVGIPCKRILLDVDRSYKQGFTQEEKPMDFVLHTRNLVFLSDPKYDVKGIYISDSTWDNNRENNLYLNCLMTFDRKKEARLPEKLSDEDLLLDFHDAQDFAKKIDFYITKNTRRENNTAEMEEHLRCLAYKNIYLRIIEILQPLDYKKAKELYRKYNGRLNVDTSLLQSQDLVRDLEDLLSDYAEYIIPIVNQEIKNETILAALANVQRVLHHKSEEQIKKYIDKVVKENKLMEQLAFPYQYDRNMPEAFVGSRYMK